MLLTFKVVNADDKIYQDNNGHYVLLDTIPDGETLTLSENSSLNQDGSIIYMEQESQDQSYSANGWLARAFIVKVFGGLSIMNILYGLIVHFENKFSLKLISAKSISVKQVII